MIPKRPFFSFTKPLWLLLSLGGMVLFIVFYAVASSHYPGGSGIAPNQQGFNFWNNYLCDLLDKYAINGELNAARHYARASLVALCSGLLLFWYHLPGLFKSGGSNLRVMQLAGMAAFAATFFLASGTHDLIVRIAGIFGVIAVVGCLKELFKAGHYKLFGFGLFCLGIFLANYYIYETGYSLQILPVVQKVTFASFLFWFAALQVFLFRRFHKKSSIHRYLT